MLFRLEHPIATKSTKSDNENQEFSHALPKDLGITRYGNLDGGRQTRVVEPEALTVLREYEILWKRQEVDLLKLAKLRWIEKWTLRRIARELGIGVTTARYNLRRASEDPRVKTLLTGK